ncbi:Glucosyl transferase GtrII [Nocardioides alpinus]|uniref:Glucosyl transferase GtrII n=1 Tax=Nocardioides alpinus TaxID=748909 RepID=A0A1I0W2L8_9ACTN|nr:Glucosyl transferase GtrII [Nocardioides alpinus]
MIVVALAMLLTYGYEVFNFNLSLDEPVLLGGGQRSLASLFASQGRWGMALQYAVLPETVLPVVSAGLAVLLVGASLWVLATKVFGLSPMTAGFITAVAATMPTIGFGISFATIALGIGLGFAASAIYGVCATSTTWQRLALAVLAGTLAMGIYQGFAFTLLAISLSLVARRSDWRFAGRNIGLLATCALANVVIGALAKRALGAPSDTYVNDVMDLPGLASDPWGRLSAASARNVEVLAPGASLYDNLQPWLALLLTVLVVLAIRSSLRVSSHQSRIVRPLALLALLVTPVVAALLVDELPIRSMVYLPVCLLGLTAIAIADAGPEVGSPSTQVGITGWLAVGLCTMAVIANASVSNQAFVASEASLARDRFLALRIDEEARRLFPDAAEAPVVVVSAPKQQGLGTVGRPAEQFGLSLFTGEPWRSTSFLTSQGVEVSSPTAEEEQRGLAAAAHMPEYPTAGWAKSLDGMLVVNLGPDY